MKRGLLLGSNPVGQANTKGSRSAASHKDDYTVGVDVLGDPHTHCRDRHPRLSVREKIEPQKTKKNPDRLACYP